MIVEKPPREELEQLYTVKKWSMKAIMERLHISQATLTKLMKVCGIKPNQRRGYFPHPNNSRYNYTALRRETGKCEICGQTIKGHVKCKRCTIMVGPNHWETYVDQRGICGYCQVKAEDLRQ